MLCADISAEESDAEDFKSTFLLGLSLRVQEDPWGRRWDDGMKFSLLLMLFDGPSLPQVLKKVLESNIDLMVISLSRLF